MSSIFFYSYFDCLNYAISLVANKKINVSVSEIKRNVIYICSDNAEEFLYNFFKKKISVDKYNHFKFLIYENLVKGSPVPHLIKRVSFFGNDFYLKKGVFIPQKETELLVELVLKYCCVFFKKKKIKVLEIGTGSGCISISLAKLKPLWSFVSTDINDVALEVSKFNVKKEKLTNINVLKKDLFFSFDNLDKFDLLISNPPYLSKKEIPFIKNNVLNFQPHNALFAEDDGCFFYTKIIQSIYKILKKKFFIVLEINPYREKKILNLLKKKTDAKLNYLVFKDFKNKSRAVLIHNFR